MKVPSKPKRLAWSGRTLERLVGAREDLSEIRSLTTGLPDPGRIRQTAVCFRRLLIEGELQFVATTLGRKLSLVIPPDIPSSADLARDGVTFLHRAPAALGDVAIGEISNGPGNRGSTAEVDPFRMDGPVKLHSFLNQRVAEFFGTSIRRRDLLQYAANIMGGAHYGTRTRDLAAVDRMRSAIMIEFSDGKLVIKIQGSAIIGRSQETIFVERHYNPVHLELLSTARLLFESVSLTELRNALEEATPS